MYKSLSKLLHVVLFFILGLGLILPLPVQADDGGFVITNYQVYAHLHEDNTMEVHEIIDVNFTSPRHGIYRNIPEMMHVGYTQEERDEDPIGTLRSETYRLEIEDIRVESDPASVSSENNETQIKIGSAYQLVTGPHTYDLSYTIVFPEDYRSTRDFLFYSPLGAQWDTTIDSFSFQLDLDKALTKEEMKNMQVYSGSYGSEGNTLDVTIETTPTSISGQASHIGPQQAITLFGSLREGYYVGAKQANTKPAWIGAIVSFLLGLFVLIRERLIKKDDFTETVEFYPPDSITSAEVGYIIDGSADNKDLMSLIPYWGNKGLIAIEDSGHHSYIVHKKAPLPEDAHEYERTLFDALFGRKESIDMRNLSSSFARKLLEAEQDLTHEFTDERKLATWKIFEIICAMLLLGSFSLMFAFNSKAGLIPNAVIAGILFGLLMTVCVMKLAGSMKQHFNKRNSAGIIFFETIAFVVGFVLVAFFSTGHDRILPIPVMGALYALVVLCLIGMHRLLVPSQYWYSVAGKLAGLKTFIEKAEVPQLERLSKENPSYYFDVIPYAIAFGLSQQWAKAFETIPLTNPVWYYGNSRYNSYYYYSMFDQNINQSAFNAVSSYQASQVSSSGGFSGGGGGGGGGGSW